MKIVCIADTHNHHDKLVMPPGDVLVHVGDMTIKGKIWETQKFCDWLAEQTPKYKHTLVVAGNHDFLFETNRNLGIDMLNKAGAVYLEDKAVTIDGVKFYGAPWQPRFFDWAFNVDRGPAIAKKWAYIPDDTDVLITHGPPMGYLDGPVNAVGCADLRIRVEQVKPILHIFGHIHIYGQVENEDTTFVNAANTIIGKRGYEFKYQPQVVEI